MANAYSLLDTRLLDLVPALHRRKSVALGLKLSGYWEDVPQTLIRAANSYGIPLVVMPEGPFDEILNPVLTLITERQFARVRRGDDLHSDLAAAAVREQGAPSAIVRLLHEAIAKPVALFGESAQLLEFTGAQGVWSDTLLLDAVRSERTGFLRFANQHWSLTAIPGIRSSGHVLCAAGVEDHDAFARAALSHAAVVIGMLQVERHQVEDVHRRFQRELLEDVIAGRLQGADEATGRAAWLGWPLHQPFLVMAISLPVNRGTAEWTEQFLDDLETLVADLPLGGRALSVGPMLGLVIHLAEEQAAKQVAEKATKLIERLVAERAIGIDRVRIGVSASRSAVMELPEAFEEAALAVKLGARPQGGRVRFFEELGLAQLLAHSEDSDGLLRAARHVLDGIYHVPGKRDNELMETLAALLRSNMSVRTTAEELYLHYNTVRHRLGRLRRVLGTRLDHAHSRLELSAAINTIQLHDARNDLGHVHPRRD